MLTYSFKRSEYPTPHLSTTLSAFVSACICCPNSLLTANQQQPEARPLTNHQVGQGRPVRLQHFEHMTRYVHAVWSCFKYLFSPVWKVLSVNVCENVFCFFICMYFFCCYKSGVITWTNIDFHSWNSLMSFVCCSVICNVDAWQTSTFKFSPFFILDVSV